MNPKSPSALSLKDQEKLLRQVTLASVSLAVVLIVLKTMAWWVNHSISLEASLMDSVLDGMASIVNFFAVRHSLEPPDYEHRFGHGKLEAIATMAQGLFIITASLCLMYKAVYRLWAPVALEHNTLGIAVTFVAIVLTFLLVRFQNSVLARVTSSAVQADASHYKGDLYINLGVLVSLFLATNQTFQSPLMDTLVGGAVGVYLFYTACSVMVEAFHILMDRELSSEMRQSIGAIALQAHQEVLGIHDLRTRRSGLKIFIQMHIELDKDMSLEKSHHIATIVEKAIQGKFPHSEVLIHQDPEGVMEKRDPFET